MAHERAETLRQRLIDAENEVRTGARKRPRPVKVALALSDLCEVKGIEGTVVGVSVTDSLIEVRDKDTRQVIEVPNQEIVAMELEDA